MKIAVFSCDKYRWLVPIFWHFYKKNWKDNHHKSDIVTEKLKLPVCFSNVFYGGNESWSTTALNYLKQIDDEIIMVVLDDYIIEGVDKEAIKLCIEECKKDDIGYVLVSNREHGFMMKASTPYNENFVEYPKDQPYSLSLQIGIWKRDFLIDLLIDDKNVWEPEIEGSKRMATKTKKVLLFKGHGIEYKPGGCMRRGSQPVTEVFEWMLNQLNSLKCSECNYFYYAKTQDVGLCDLLYKGWIDGSSILYDNGFNKDYIEKKKCPMRRSICDRIH